MLSPERIGRLTASDHAAALGLSPFCSRQDLWRRWNGLAEPHSEQTLARFQYGHAHEPDAVAFYEAETGEIVTNCLDRQVFVPYEDWAGCTPDGWVGDDGLLECKVPQKLWDEPPLHYFVQVQSQLAITGRQWCDLTAWTPNGSGIWRTFVAPSYWATVSPLLVEFHRILKEGMEPKRSKKPKFNWEVVWKRIA